MKVRGIIVTTITESIAVDIDADDSNPQEASEQFMKAAITAGRSIIIGKNVQYHIVGRVAPSPQASEEAT